MSDAQFGVLVSALVTVLGSVIAMLKWSVGRIVKALDDNTASNLEDSKAKIALAEKMAIFATKLDSVANFVHENTPIHGTDVSAFRSELEAAKPKPRAKSYPHGVPTTEYIHTTRKKTPPGGTEE